MDMADTEAMMTTVGGMEDTEDTEDTEGRRVRWRR